MKPACWIALAAAAAACSSSGGGDEPTERPPAPVVIDAAPARVVLPPAPDVPPAPRGLPPTPSPAHNPTTAAKVALGQLLFFDPRLSGDDTASCATCHAPGRSYSGREPLAKTAAGQLNLRHAPPLLNAAYVRDYYWDGRVTPLEALIDANWRGQMAADPDEVAAALAEQPVYAAHFQRAFSGAPTGARIIEALAAFVRTLRSGDSLWDRYEAGDTRAVSADAVAGAALFRGRAQCAQCHPPPLYTDGRYHNVGIGDSARDPGRGRLTRRAQDQGAFRTPTLRGAARSAPYFHDGSGPDLAATLDHRPAGPGGRPPPPLSEDERRQLLAFLAALTSDTAPATAPELP